MLGRAHNCLVACRIDPMSCYNVIEDAELIYCNNSQRYLQLQARERSLEASGGEVSYRHFSIFLYDFRMSNKRGT